jgi:hypothetical protein
MVDEHMRASTVLQLMVMGVCSYADVHPADPKLWLLPYPTDRILSAEFSSALLLSLLPQPLAPTCTLRTQPCLLLQPTDPFHAHLLRSMLPVFSFRCRSRQRKRAPCGPQHMAAAAPQ